MRNLEGMDLRGLKKALRDKEDSDFKIERVSQSSQHCSGTKQAALGVFFQSEGLTLCDTLRDPQWAISYYSSEPG